MSNCIKIIVLKKNVQIIICFHLFKNVCRICDDFLEEINLYL